MHSLIERAKKNHTIFTPDQMYGIIMNAKINGEKFHLVEMEQCNFFDLKEIMVKRYWLRADQTNEKVMWTKIHEIKVTQEHPDVIYFKYYFDDDHLSLDTAPNTRPARGRGKRIPMTEADRCVEECFHGADRVTKTTPRRFDESLQNRSDSKTLSYIL